MKNTIKAIVALSLVSTVAFAASEGRKPRPVACEGFSSVVDGAKTYALCPSAREGGKPTLLRSYTVATVTDPEGHTVKVAVGFR